MMAVIMCADETLVENTKFHLPPEPEINAIFICCERHFLSQDFKGLKVVHEGSVIVLSEIKTPDTNGKETPMYSLERKRDSIVSLKNQRFVNISVPSID